MKKRIFTLLGGVLYGALMSLTVQAQEWTDITDDNVTTSEANLLSNPSFETLGSVKSGSQYNIGEPWTWNIGSANIRVESHADAKNGSYALFWRGSGNNNFISQSVSGLKANTWYEVKLSQILGSNANADYYIGIGTEAGTYELANTTVKLGTNNNGIKKVWFRLPSNVSETTTYYFTLANTPSNTASGSDPLSRIDWISLVECCEDATSGTWYMYDEKTGTFLSRGSTWGTRSTTDTYGYPIEVVGTKPLTYLLKELDMSVSNVGLGTNLYTDNGSPCEWTFSGDAENGYTAYNATAGGYLTANGCLADTKVVTDAADASKWKLMSATEYKIFFTDKEAADKNAVLTAAGITDATFDAYISQCSEREHTSMIQNAALSGDTGGWTWTAGPSRGGSIATNGNGSECYEGIGNLTQTVTGLNKGIYKVTIQGFYRDGSNANCVQFDNAGWVMSNMYFKANDFETRIMGWAEDRAGDANPNSMSDYKALADAAPDDNGVRKYENAFYTYVGEDGQLALNIGIPGFVGGGWAIFSNVTLTYYIHEVSEADAAELLASIPTDAMYSVTKAALDEAVEAFESNKSIANYNALAEAIKTANASVADYAKLKAAIESLYTVIDPTYTALATAKSEAQTIYESGSAATCDAAIAALNTAVNAAKVADYDYVVTDFQYGVELGDWIPSGPTGKKTDQHWSGNSREYLEQSEAAWNQNAWSISYNQDVTLPAGDYVFKVAGRRAAGNSCTLQLVVTDKTTSAVIGTVSDFPEGDSGLGINKTGATSFDPADPEGFTNDGNGRGFQWRYVKFSLTESATVNIAVSANATDYHQWVSFCDATVQTNADANIAMIAYNVALNDANTALNNDTYANVTGSEKSALEDAIAADMSGMTKSEIEAATTALKDLTTAFTSAKGTYDEFAAVKTAEVPTLPYAADVRKDAVTATQSATPANAAACATALNDYYTALRAYYESNAMAEGYDGAKNVTSWITNPLFTDGLNGWTSSQSGGKLGVLNNEPPTYSDGSNAAYYDYYNGSANNQHGYQILQNLPAGVYYLTVTVRADVNLNNVFVKMGDQQIAINKIGATGGVFGRGWNDYSVEYTNAKMQDVTIEVYSTPDGGNKSGWLGFTNVRLVQLQAGAQLSINPTAQYGTFIAPFSVTIPEGVEAFTCSSTNGSTLVLNGLLKTIPANKPVIVFSKSEEGIDQTFYGKSTATEDTYTDGLLTGVYTATTAPVGSYVLMLSDDKAVFGTVVADHQPTVGANRCYFTAPADNVAKAFFFGHGTTNIDNVGINAPADDVIYDLTGRRVEKATKGIYIINGKKAYIK